MLDAFSERKAEMSFNVVRCILLVIVTTAVVLAIIWAGRFILTPQFSSGDLGACDDTASETIDPTLDGSVVEDDNFAPCGALTAPENGSPNQPRP